MRSRNLKPSIFRNELLAVADPIYTIIFEGLWCVADREGRLEDRPAKLHLEINPGRAFETTERSLAWLYEHGFIVRYGVGQGRFIQVVNFLKHQNPHHKEPQSTIPMPQTSPGQDQGSSSCDSYIYREEPETNPGPDQDQPQASLGLDGQGSVEHGGKTVLIPDSGFLIPDSGFPQPPPQGGGGMQGGGGKTSRKQDARATRLPDDWPLTDERTEIARAEGLDPTRTFAKFTDYWRSVGGNRGCKRDWDATWRNWCRTEADRNGPRSSGWTGPNGGKPPTPLKLRTAEEQERIERERGDHAEH